MATLVTGVVSRSRQPRMLVENPLKPGQYRFRLSVVDDTGNESAPAEITVLVRGQAVPPPLGGPVVRPPVVRPPVARPVPLRRPRGPVT